MFPYKTRFQTDFEVDWGRTYPKEIPAERERKELQLFNIKDFVKKQKEEKMKEMGAFEPENNPFGRGPSPFMGNPFMNPNPFASMSGLMSPPESKPDEEDTFNIDDIIKKIDETIAQKETEFQSHQPKQ